MLYEIFGKYVDKIYVYECSNQGGENSFASLIEDGVVLSKKMKAGATVPCDMVFNRRHVTAEGYMDACCVDMSNYLAIADLHSVSLEDAWNSDEFKELRRKHLTGKIAGTQCFNCVHIAETSVKPLNEKLVNLCN